MMVNKIVLNEEQKLYLIRCYDLDYSYLKKHLELLHRQNDSNWPWELCTGSRSVGRYYTNHIVEELTARPESRIKYSDIIIEGKAGDKLKGKFYVESPGNLESRKWVSEIVLNRNIYSQLNNGDILEGARYFLKKLVDGSFKVYVIIK